MRIAPAIALIATCLGLSACGTTQDEWVEKTLARTVNVSIIDAHSFDFVPRASCIFSGKNNDTYKITKNPEQIILPSWEDQVHVSCQASDYYQEQIAISNTLENWTYDDLAFLPSNVIIFDPSAPRFDAKYLVVFMSHTPSRSQKTSQRQFNHEQKTETLFQGTLR